MNISALQQVTDWLIDGARSATTPTLMMSEACERLVQAGLPLWRVGVFIRMLHPDVFGRGFFWRPGSEVMVTPRISISGIRPNTAAARSRCSTTRSGK